MWSSVTGFFPVIARTSTSFLFYCPGIGQSIYSSVDVLLSCFHFFFMNNAAMNICVQVFMWMYVLISVECIPGNEIAGSYANCLAF